MDKIPIKMTWQISVPIFKNSLILRQLGIAVGIPFGLVAIMIRLISGNPLYTLYFLGVLVALLFLTWLFMMAVYKGKYEVEFILDEKGVLCRTQEKQTKKNRVVNTLTVLFGLISGKPAVTGAGMQAHSRQVVFLQWKHITKVKNKPQQKTILLRGGWTENIALFCTQENYPIVEEIVMTKMLNLKKNKKTTYRQERV